MNLDPSNTPQPMTSAQMAGLVDAAFRSPRPETFLSMAAGMFEMLGRIEDAASAGWMGYLLHRGEVEALMSLRAAWRRGEVRDPGEAACRCTHVQV